MNIHSIRSSTWEWKECSKVNKSQCISINFGKKAAAELILPWPMKVQFNSTTDTQSPYALTHTSKARCSLCVPNAYTVCVFYFQNQNLNYEKKNTNSFPFAPKKHIYDNHNGWKKKRRQRMLSLRAYTHESIVQFVILTVACIVCASSDVAFFCVFSRSNVLCCTYA